MSRPTLMRTDSLLIALLVTRRSTGRSGASITINKQTFSWTVGIAMRVAIHAIASLLKSNSDSATDATTVIAQTTSMTESSASTADDAIRPTPSKRCSESNEDANLILAQRSAALVTGTGTGTIRSLQHRI